MAFVGDFILIDSNIWCFYFDESCKEHKSVKRFIEKTIGKEKIIINAIVIMEVSHFLIKNLGSKIGQKKVDIFLSLPMEILELDFQLMKNSVEMLADYSHFGIGGRDATLLASLKRTKSNILTTHDSAFKKIDWVKVIDPIKF